MDYRLAFSPERGNGKCHGNSVIAERIQLSPVQILPPGNAQSIGTLLNLGAHLSKIDGDGGDTIRLFHTQLFAITHFEPLTAVRRNRRQYRDLVDQCSRVGPGDQAPLPTCSPRLDRTYQFTVMFL